MTNEFPNIYERLWPISIFGGIPTYPTPVTFLAPPKHMLSATHVTLTSHRVVLRVSGNTAGRGLWGGTYNTSKSFTASTLQLLCCSLVNVLEWAGCCVRCLPECYACLFTPSDKQHATPVPWIAIAIAMDTSS